MKVNKEGKGICKPGIDPSIHGSMDIVMSVEWLEAPWKACKEDESIKKGLAMKNGYLYSDCKSSLRFSARGAADEM
jgi:hypothetical protein